MYCSRSRNLTAALCAAAAVSAAPAPSSAGVMSVTGKDAISLSQPAEQIHWRAYQHRHHRWHMGWRYGGPRYRYGMYPGWTTAPAAYGSAYPAGMYGSAYPGCATPGYYGYAGDGLFGLGAPGGGLFGLGLGPL
ncbi:hypothetical protein [Methylocystis sp. Sn-Cys]|uniref:hypothetical protein n=1 Tax=Methylocystis sp. Sn-Cys TaxID=1701263 RepID=UPI001921FBD3|nr:hypothetical protein [Methylocystis sp. Sn-Cys]MBL1255269.1 hypothetical protein [Methylocystis sp. Sn-Cys]